MAQLRPDCTPEVVAADVERGWLLTRDAGRPLAELLEENRDPRLVDEALALYADLQVAAAPHIEEALGYGTPDARPARLRPQYDTVVADRALLAVGGRGGVTPAEQERLIARAPHVDDLVERLGDAVPASVAHEEVHEANTFLRDGRIRILDWADASVGHPFASLTGPIRSYGWRFGVEPGDPLLDRFRDAYLEPWTTLAAHDDLVDVFAAAYQLGMVCRILSYANSLRSLDAATHAEYVQDMTLWLRVWLAANDGPATLGV
jgi:hypothetical protein